MITKLKENEIFVFGSNEAGIHGAGAARQALDQFGARWGVGFGPQGKTFAIPTKDWSIRTLPIQYIKPYVNSFLSYALTQPNLVFLVTEIGCGLAGYKPKDIAPLFVRGTVMSNITLPDKFKEVLGV